MRFLLTFCALCLLIGLNNPLYGQQNKVIIKGIPFTIKAAPSFEVTNNQLNIGIQSVEGDFLQITGIALSDVRQGILGPRKFRCVLIMANGTISDDRSRNSRDLLEIKCSGNEPGQKISVGIKSTLMKDKSKFRTYATLHGIIPSYSYLQTQ